MAFSRCIRILPIGAILRRDDLVGGVEQLVVVLVCDVFSWSHMPKLKKNSFS